MLAKLIQSNMSVNNAPREGELYKSVSVFGRTFELKYGYYSDSDRKYEPDIIYPNFIENPEYTDDGRPFVTAMQEPCKEFSDKRGEDSTCGDCSYYNKGTELIGICVCSKNEKE